ncbi:hypothetical protein MMC31_000230 [Peltigera leucophlebia]|nr:hypothetical protein [Peltigera leucophlebia]
MSVADAPAQYVKTILRHCIGSHIVDEANQISFACRGFAPELKVFANPPTKSTKASDFIRGEAEGLVQQTFESTIGPAICASIKLRLFCRNSFCSKAIQQNTPWIFVTSLRTAPNSVSTAATNVVHSKRYSECLEAIKSRTSVYTEVDARPGTVSRCLSSANSPTPPSSRPSIVSAQQHLQASAWQQRFQPPRQQYSPCCYRQQQQTLFAQSTDDRYAQSQDRLNLSVSAPTGSPTRSTTLPPTNPCLTLVPMSSAVNSNVELHETSSLVESQASFNASRPVRSQESSNMLGRLPTSPKTLRPSLDTLSSKPTEPQASLDADVDASPEMDNKLPSTSRSVGSHALPRQSKACFQHRTQ